MATRAATWKEGTGDLHPRSHSTTRRGSHCHPGLDPKRGGGEKTVGNLRAANRNMKIWMIKKLIKSLEVACGSTAGNVQLRTWDNRNI